MFLGVLADYTVGGESGSQPRHAFPHAVNNFSSDTVCKTMHGLWMRSQMSGSRRSQSLSAAWLKEHRRSRANSVRASKVEVLEGRLPNAGVLIIGSSFRSTWRLQSCSVQAPLKRCSELLLRFFADGLDRESSRRRSCKSLPYPTGGPQTNRSSQPP